MPEVQEGMQWRAISRPSTNLLENEPKHEEDIPTINNSNEAYNNQWNQSTEPNASLWTIITNFIREDSLSRNTLLDSALRMLANKNRDINVLGLKT